MEHMLIFSKKNILQILFFYKLLLIVQSLFISKTIDCNHTHTHIQTYSRTHTDNFTHAHARKQRRYGTTHFSLLDTIIILRNLVP